MDTSEEVNIETEVLDELKLTYAQSVEEMVKFTESKGNYSFIQKSYLNILKSISSNFLISMPLGCLDSFMASFKKTWKESTMNMNNSCKEKERWVKKKLRVKHSYSNKSKKKEAEMRKGWLLSNTASSTLNLNDSFV